MSHDRRRRKYGRHESELLQCLMGYMSQTGVSADGSVQTAQGTCPRCHSGHQHQVGVPVQDHTDSYHHEDQGSNSVGFHQRETGAARHQIENSQYGTYQSQGTPHAYQKYVQNTPRKKDYGDNQSNVSEGKSQKGQAPRDRWPSPPPPIYLPSVPRGATHHRPTISTTDAVWTPRTPGVLEHRAPSPLTASSSQQRRSRIDYHEAPIYHDTEMYKSKSFSGAGGETGIHAPPLQRQNRVTFATPTRSQTMPRLRTDNKETKVIQNEDNTVESMQRHPNKGQLRYRSKSHSPQRSRHFVSMSSQESTESSSSQGARPKTLTGSPQTPKFYLPRVPSAHSNPLPTASTSGSPCHSLRSTDTCPSRCALSAPSYSAAKPCGFCVVQDTACKVSQFSHDMCSDDQILAAAAAVTAMGSGSASNSYLPRDPEIYLGERHQRAMVRLCALLWVANQVKYLHYPNVLLPLQWN